jgi:hypothetical protein
MRNPCDDEEDFGPIDDQDAWDEAVARLKRGELAEAMIWLSRASESLDDLPLMFERHVKHAVDTALANASSARQSSSRRAAA